MQEQDRRIRTVEGKLDQVLGLLLATQQPGETPGASIATGAEGVAETGEGVCASQLLGQPDLTPRRCRPDAASDSTVP